MGYLLMATHTYCTGMLSKSKGQVLHLSTVLHLLFHYKKEDQLLDVVSETAINAAIDFVQVSCQQTAIIASKGSWMSLSQSANQVRQMNMNLHTQVVNNFI